MTNIYKPLLISKTNEGKFGNNVATVVPVATKYNANDTPMTIPLIAPCFVMMTCTGLEPVPPPCQSYVIKST